MKERIYGFYKPKHQLVQGDKSYACALIKQVNESHWAGSVILNQNPERIDDQHKVYDTVEIHIRDNEFTECSPTEQYKLSQLWNIESGDHGAVPVSVTTGIRTMCIHYRYGLYSMYSSQVDSEFNPPTSYICHVDKPTTSMLIEHGLFSIATADKIAQEIRQKRANLLNLTQKMNYIHAIDKYGVLDVDEMSQTATEYDNAILEAKDLREYGFLI